jgi:Mg2+ and Co2+ transporter CorA
MYNLLSDDYDNCKERAEIIDERIDKIQRIAQDLFSEWRQEIDQIHNPAFRSQSARKLKVTQSRFASLESALMTARKRMTPVLANLKDYVLYLKHNLNAQAIGSLKGEASSIETDVDRLVRDIQRSIQEADAFLKEIEK